MRKYTLASPNARITVDLRDYAQTIIDSVHTVLPAATVKVEKDCYYVSPTPELGSAIKIGRLICQSDLSKHCIQIPKLFSSIEMEERNDDNNQPQKHHGGHFPDRQHLPTRE